MELPKLRAPLSKITIKDLRVWVLNEVHRDLLEQNALTYGKINWSQKGTSPSFWPNHLLEWKDTEPFYREQTKLQDGIDFVDILREAARQRILDFNEDPDTYIEHSEACSEENITSLETIECHIVEKDEGNNAIESLAVETI